MQDIQCFLTNLRTQKADKSHKKIYIYETDSFLINENNKLYYLSIKLDKSLLFEMNDDSESKITYDYVHEFNCIYLGCSKKIYLFDVEAKKIHFNADFDENILKVVFSHDGSVGCVLLENKQILLVSQELDVLNEINLDNVTECQITSINVGWGKKETQFHGSLGKAAAFADSEKNTPSSETNDDGIIHIAWRDDNKFVTVSYINASGYRILKTFTDQLELYSINEETEGVQSNIFYLPKYFLLGATRRTKYNKLDLIFFEVNGQRHKIFNLLNKKNFQDPEFFDVKKIESNSNGSLTAMLFEPTAKNPDKSKSFVGIYSFIQFQWTCKRMLQMTNSDMIQDSINFGWCKNELGLENLVIYNDGQRLEINLHPKSFNKINLSNSNGDIFFCLDNTDLKISDFTSAIIPPPLCSAIICVKTQDSFKVPIAAYCAYSEDSRNLTLTLLTWNGDLLEVVLGEESSYDSIKVNENTVEFTRNVGNMKKLKKLCQVNLISGWREKVSNSTLTTNMTRISQNCLLFVTENATKILIAHLKSNSIDKVEEIFSLKDANSCIYKTKVISNNIDNGILVQTNLKEMYHIKKSDSAYANTLIGVLPEICEEFDLISMYPNTNSMRLNEFFLIGHSKRLQKLYLLKTDVPLGQENIGKFLLNNITSYAIHESFLALTTVDKMLFLSKGNLENISSTERIKSSAIENFIQEFLESNLERERVNRKPEISSVYPIESDSLIITSCDDYVILQMPRGNLEKICPKPLLLNKIIKIILDKHDYLAAGLSMRKNRIDLNLLYDASPNLFESNMATNVEKFINSSASDLLNIFINSLQNKDLTKTDYESFFRDNKFHTTSISDSATKVNNVCSRLIIILEDKMTTSPSIEYLTALLSCYAKITPNQIDKGLQLLTSFQNVNEKFYSIGLKHLQYYVNVDELFKIALGIYDIKLAINIARITQMDPKEYLSILKRIHEILPNGNLDDQLDSLKYKQMAEIDLNLERWPRAIDNFFLSSSEENWEKILELAKKYKLYENIFYKYEKISKDKTRIILDHWKSELPVYKVGLLYLRAKLWTEASEIFFSISKPNEYTIAMANRLNAPSNDPDHIAIEKAKPQILLMIAKAKSVNQYQQAVQIAEKLLADVTLACEIAIEGDLYNLSKLYISKSPEKRSDLESKLSRSLQKQYQTYYDMITRKHQEFSNYFSRLVSLRKEHAADSIRRRLAIQRGEIDPLDDSVSEMSIFSMSSQKTSSSTLSNSSIKTKANLIKKRKPKKTQWNLKEGSRFEEIALIEALANSYQQVQNLATEINDLSMYLMLESMNLESEKIIDAYNRLLSEQLGHVNKIWDDYILGNVIPDPDDPAPSRKTYDFKEPFLNFPPNLTIQKIDKIFSAHKMK